MNSRSATIARIATTPKMMLTMFFLTRSMVQIQKRFPNKEVYRASMLSRSVLLVRVRRVGGRRGNIRRRIQLHEKAHCDHRIAEHVLIGHHPVAERDRFVWCQRGARATAAGVECRTAVGQVAFV